MQLAINYFSSYLSKTKIISYYVLEDLIIKILLSQNAPENPFLQLQAKYPFGNLTQRPLFRQSHNDSNLTKYL